MRAFGLMVVIMVLGAACSRPENKEISYPVTLMTLDPGHFHAALVQKYQYVDVNPEVYVYAPDGPEVREHLLRIRDYNEREQNPTRWEEVLYTGPDYLSRMLEEVPGNVMVVSGNNRLKTDYIKQAVEAGIHVLADKPMVIDPDRYDQLVTTIREAQKRDVLVYDIMTERYEVTTQLQKALSRDTVLFGHIRKGSAEEPAITKESVHYLSKEVSGKPLIRPAWFFDPDQQGLAIADVGTHLVDLVLWECFDKQLLTPDDTELTSARIWNTTLTPEQFFRVTGTEEIPEYLVDYLEDSVLSIPFNGSADFMVGEIHARVSVRWDYKAKEGGDTHYSIMRGTRADLTIEQGPEQSFVPVLYATNNAETSNEVFEERIETALIDIKDEMPGIEVLREEDRWRFVIPEKLREGHEAHFAQVTERFLDYFEKGEIPDWEIAFMITRYYITTESVRRAKFE